jgi:hypothetical protein
VSGQLGLSTLLSVAYVNSNDIKLEGVGGVCYFFGEAKRMIGEVMIFDLLSYAKDGRVELLTEPWN